MEELRAIKIVHDRKNRVLYNILAEFFRFIGIFVLEDAVDSLPREQQSDDTQFVIYLMNERFCLSKSLEDKPYCLIIVGEDNFEKLNMKELRELTLQPEVLQTENAQKSMQGLFAYIFDKIYLYKLNVSQSVMQKLLDIYLEQDVVIAACDLQYYRMLSEIHVESKKKFLNAVEKLQALEDDDSSQKAGNSWGRGDRQGEFYYRYSVLYCKQRVNLACWFLKDGEYYLRGNGELCDKNGFRRQLNLEYGVAELVKECWLLIREYPEKANLCVLLGLITERADDAFQLTINAYQEAVQKIGEQPYASHVYYWLGWRFERNNGTLSEAKKAYGKAYLLQHKYRNIYKVAVMYESEGNKEQFIQYLMACRKEIKHRTDNEGKLDPLEIEYYCKSCLLLCLRFWNYWNDADKAIEYGEEVLKFIDQHIINDMFEEYQTLYGSNKADYQRESQNRIRVKRLHEVLTAAYRSIGDMEQSEMHRAKY